MLDTRFLQLEICSSPMRNEDSRASVVRNDLTAVRLYSWGSMGAKLMPQTMGGDLVQVFVNAVFYSMFW